MARHNLVAVFGVFLVCFLGSVKVSYATIHLAHGHFANAHFGTDPCAGKSIGQACTGGALYAGTYNGHHYMTTPGHCTDYADNSTAFSPVCSGSEDTVMHAWANNSGTTAYGVNTGATDNSNGKSNTTTLSANYTDTDAARYCHYMNYGGYTDWILPAMDELNYVLYANKAALGGFWGSVWWSSTEYNGLGYHYAQNQQFSSQDGGIQGASSMTNGFLVRCVRSY